MTQTAPALPWLRRAIVAAAALSLAWQTGCRRQLSHASNHRDSVTQSERLVAKTAPGVATFLIPEGWHWAQGEYPSPFPGQSYQMVRVTVSESDEDLGLLSIDISPSHPALFDLPLADHAQRRLRHLRQLGAVEPLELPTSRPESAGYDVAEALVDVADTLRTTFRIFRQKSRVVTVAYTATAAHFDAEAAARLVAKVSDELIVHLPVVPYTPPSLKTERRAVDGVLVAELPIGWKLSQKRDDASLVPTDMVELVPPSGDPEEAQPRLTLSVVHLSDLGPDVALESVTFQDGGDTAALRPGGPHATVVTVDRDTLAAVRMEHVAGDIVTITYAAPEFMFEVKPALALLDTIARSIRLLAPAD